MIQIPPRRVAVALLAAPVLLGGVAFAAIDAIQTTRAPEGYRISIAPGRQSAAPGQGLRYVVAIRRSGGFSKPVALRLSGLPRGTKARWIQQDGTRAAVLPGGAKGAVLTLRTTRRTPTGTRRITLHASGGGIQRQVRLVARIRRKRFGVWALPARAVVASGDAARFRVKVQRGKHFKGRVRLRVTRLPRGARAHWSRKRTRLRVKTAPGSPPQVARVVVRARSRHRVRRTVMLLEIRRRTPFGIEGDLGTPLYPGASVPLDLTLVNPHAVAIRVTRLQVAVDRATSKPGCDGAVHYATRAYAGRLPLLLPPGRTKLSRLEPDRTRWPHVGMRDLPFDQGVCKGAELTLRYDGTAVQ